jgi:hypothetical protein
MPTVSDELEYQTASHRTAQEVCTIGIIFIQVSNKFFYQEIPVQYDSMNVLWERRTHRSGASPNFQSIIKQPTSGNSETPASHIDVCICDSEQCIQSL